MSRGKVQLCGRFVVELDDRRVEDELPGRQGRLLLAFVVTNRLRTIARDELVEALWPSGQDLGLAPLLSKLRRVVPLDGLRPAVGELWVDIEAAAAAVHRAESSLALGDPHAAWGPSQVAMFVAARPFLAGEEAPWIDVERLRLGELHCARSRRMPLRRSASAGPSCPLLFAPGGNSLPSSPTASRGTAS